MLLNKNFILPFLILFLCLTACANKQTDNNLDNVNPFAATGLLAHPTETAEEILLRAHSHDPEAMLLVTTGYTLGIGYFPKDNTLSTSWRSAYIPESAPYTLELLLLMHNYAFDRYAPPSPSFCAAAKHSFATPLLKQAGIFDLDTVCAEVGYDHDYYRGNSYDDFKKLIAELINRTITKQDLEILNTERYSFDLSNEYIGYQIATAGNSKASILERQLNLLKFIAQREGESFPKSKELKEIAANTLMQIGSAEVYDPVALEIIHKAHQGNFVAIRQMAENYRTGAMGFPKNLSLDLFWLQRGINAKDKRASDTEALWVYVSMHPEVAWRFAHVAMIYGSPEMKEVFTFVIKETEKSFTAAELQEMQKRLDEQLEEMKTSGCQAN